MSRFTYAVKNHFYSEQRSLAEAGQNTLSSTMAILADVADAAGKVLKRANIDDAGQIDYLKSTVLSHIDFEESMGNLTVAEKLTVVELVQNFFGELSSSVA